MKKWRSFSLDVPKGKGWLMVLAWLVALIVIPLVLHYCFGVNFTSNGPVPD